GTGRERDARAPIGTAPLTHDLVRAQVLDGGGGVIARPPQRLFASGRHDEPASGCFATKPYGVAAELDGFTAEVAGRRAEGIRAIGNHPPRFIGSRRKVHVWDFDG